VDGAYRLLDSSASRKIALAIDSISCAFASFMLLVQGACIVTANI
jgi:hypothetical protein